MADDKPRGGLLSRLFGPRQSGPDPAPEPEPMRPLDWGALDRQDERPAGQPVDPPADGPSDLAEGRQTDRLSPVDVPPLETGLTETVETALPLDALERERPDGSAAADAGADAARLASPEPARPDPPRAEALRSESLRSEILRSDAPWPTTPRPDAPRPEPVRPASDPLAVRQESMRQEPTPQATPSPEPPRSEPSRSWWRGREADAALRPEPGDMPAEVPDAPGRGWWGRLRGGLSRSSTALQGGIGDLFKKQLGVEAIEDLEDVLIQADLGLDVALRITREVGTERFARGASPEAIRRVLAAEVQRELEPVAVPLALDRSHKPFVVLMVGVNGSGKTTTIGKLAAKFSSQGLRVTMAAGDTFRAAAIEQLQVWGRRTGSPVVARQQGADAAGLVFDAMNDARANGSDVLLVDTAGRLQNRAELMDELAKVVRVLKKADPTAPHAVLLVLDATVGQNALGQVEAFRTTAGVTGLVMTKLDGTARGGILVALAARFKLPVHFIGVGEGVEDLEPFSARDFAHAIAGLD